MYVVTQASLEQLQFCLDDVSGKRFLQYLDTGKAKQRPE
jgi:hypothetical protein